MFSWENKRALRMGFRLVSNLSRDAISDGIVVMQMCCAYYGRRKEHGNVDFTMQRDAVEQIWKR